MTRFHKEDLSDYLSGLFAFDTGCTDSGIHDEELRHEVKTYLNTLEVDAFRLLLSRYIRDNYLDEPSLELGYGLEDVKSFISWLADYMDIYI